MTSRRPGSSSATRIRIASGSHGSRRGSEPAGLAPLNGSRRDTSEAEGENRADGDGPPGMVEERVGDATVADDGIAPVVELDQLGQELGAHAEPVARDPIDD